nr:MAG TPA_asm: hypothetical protein [Caudoviricetes sp.]
MIFCAIPSPPCAVSYKGRIPFSRPRSLPSSHFPQSSLPLFVHNPIFILHPFRCIIRP